MRSFWTLASLLLALKPAMAIKASIIEEYCYTKMGPVKPYSVPTSTITSKIKVKVTSTHTRHTIATTTPSTTITTDSTTTFTTTNSQQTDTATITNTDTTTATETTTEISTETTTDTTTVFTTPTQTIPASPYFTPVASQANYIALAGSSKRSASEDREVLRAKARTPVDAFGGGFSELETRSKLPKALKPICSKPRYPVSVECIKYVKVFNVKDKTITKTRIATAPITTFTSTSTVSATETAPIDDATTTETDFTTVTATTTKTESSTTTEIQTSTATGAAPTATEYAMCTPENIVSHVGNKEFVTFFGFTSYVELGQIGPAECCKACALSSTCFNFALYPDGTCFHASSSAGCNPSSLRFTSTCQVSDIGDTEAYTIGNGNCGLTNLVSLG